MTTRTPVFDGPFLLGFEHTWALIERTAKSAAEGYPPYNVEPLDERHVRITLAMAGFSADQLQVTIEGRQLLVAGRRSEAAGETGAYLHRGIGARGFQRAFVLAEGMEVRAATLEHGLLHVDVARLEPDHQVVRIPIRTAG